MSRAPRRRAAPRSPTGSRKTPTGVIPARGQGDAAARLATFKAEAAARRRDDRRGRLAPPRFPPRSRAICASTICRRRCAWAPTRASPRCPGPRPRWRSRRGASDGHDLNAVSAAFAGDRRDRHAGARLRARTIRRRSISCPTITSSSSFARGRRRRSWRACSPSLRAAYGAGPGAAHAQFHHRPVALGRHRADAAVRRARAAAAAYRGGFAVLSPGPFRSGTSQESLRGDLVTLLWLGLAEAPLAERA